MSHSHPDNLEERLRHARPNREVDPAFVHRLRRALLNAPHYTESPLVRWRKRVGGLLPLASGAVVAGFAAAVFMTAPAANNETAAPGATLTIVNPASLKRLERRGRLHYVEQTAHGSRVYRLELANGETLEVLDQAPYVIQLTNQRR